MRISNWSTNYSTNVSNLQIAKWSGVSPVTCKKVKNGILLPKLFWHTVRKKCSSDRVNFLKFEAEGQEFANFLRSLEQFIGTVKNQNNFG